MVKMLIDKYNIFEPSELRELALHATDVYFANMSEDAKKKLMDDPVKYTMAFAILYRDTLKALATNDEFLESRNRK